MRRSAAPVVGATLLSGVATACIVLVPSLHFAYRQHELHVGFETAAALIGLLAAYLLLGRFRQTRALDDLALFAAFSVFALVNLFFAALPTMVTGTSSNALSTWAALSGRMLGALLLAVAAFVPRGKRLVRKRAGLTTFLGSAAVLAIAAIFLSAFSGHLPSGVEAQVTPEESVRPRLDTHTTVLVVQLTAMGFFALAAIGFMRRAAARGDEFLAWLAVASVFGAFSRLNYFLYPSLYTEWVYSGDVFRLLFFATVLVAALREIASYWRAAAAAAVLEERRRIARDLHDGLAQELAFVRRNLSRLDPDDPVVAHTRRGAERALTEARRGIAVLTDDVDQPLDVLLAETAREVAEREGASVALSLAQEVRVTPEQREALLRIVSEAIANAARHGDARLVRVALEDGDRIRVRVTDTGSGFEPDAVDTRGHFGLASMRARAHALGGELRISSRPGEGAEVEVVL
jgi:signal transduction histidine kinase